LYGERAGTFSMVTSSPEERERVLSQIKRVIRPLYSSPPMHGAQLVATILGTPELYKQWYDHTSPFVESGANGPGWQRSRRWLIESSLCGSSFTTS
jgi:aspartate/tyrosine/aromatic aminotransferase